MTKEQVYKLLQILDSNDCLHPEWDWAELNEEMGETGELTDESVWVVEEINRLLPNAESIH